eukprot:jgi/Phyca11/108412/e_gw1.15.537.1
MDGETPKQKQKSYTVREKREAVLRMSAVGVEKASRELNVARGTAHGWWKQADELLPFTGHAPSKTLKGQGRKGNAWMDAVSWQFYVDKLLKYEINEPSVLLLDNFECHVSEAGQRAMAEIANATVVPLPANSTAVCQPLDVGVMGPLKAKMRSNWSGITGESAKSKRLRAVRAAIAA